jgi:hypothetical protein
VCVCGLSLFCSVGDRGPTHTQQQRERTCVAYVCGSAARAYKKSRGGGIGIRSPGSPVSGMSSLSLFPDLRSISPTTHKSPKKVSQKYKYTYVDSAYSSSFECTHKNLFSTHGFFNKQRSKENPTHTQSRESSSSRETTHGALSPLCSKDYRV